MLLGMGCGSRWGRDLVGVVLLVGVVEWFILKKSSFRTCSFCSQVSSEISTFSPSSLTLPLHMHVKTCHEAYVTRTFLLQQNQCVACIQYAPCMYACQEDRGVGGIERVLANPSTHKHNNYVCYGGK